MMRIGLAAAAAALALAAAVAPGAALAAVGPGEGPGEGWDEGYEPGKVLVVFEQGASQAQADRAVSAVQAVADDEVDAAALDQPVKIAKVDVADGATVEEAVAELEAEDGVAYAQPNYAYRLYDDPSADAAPLEAGALGPVGASARDAGAAASSVAARVLSVVAPATTATNDKLRSKQWYLSSISSYKSWDLARCGDDGEPGSVTVAVLDTGITMDHYDLKGRIVAPYDVVGDTKTDSSPSAPDDSPDDESGHGSHVSGIIAAEANNAYGTVGVSYNANIMPMRVCYYSSEANGYIAMSEDLAAAYTRLLSRAPDDVNGDGTVGTYAEEYNVHVANMSLGALYNENAMTEDELKADKAVLDLVDRAYARGILTVCAAGNDNSSAYSWPSDYPTCVSVISLDKTDARSSFSNYGKDKDISAPGSDIFSTVPMSYASQGTTVRDADGNLNCFANMSGTSMASPVVAGVAAQVFAANPSLTPSEVKSLLYETATDLGSPGFDEQFGYGKVNAYEAVRAATAQSATGIEGLPTEAVAGVPLVLTGTVVPASASYRDIVFAVKDAGPTGATVAGDTFTATAAGTATLTATIANGGVGGADFVKEFQLVVTAPDSGTGDDPVAGDDPDPSAAPQVRVSGLAASYTFTGAAIRPALKVKAGTAALAEGTDYTLTYRNNVNVGTATGTLTLKGNYTGSRDFSFKIAPVPAAGVSVSGLASSYTFTGAAIRPALKVKAGTAALAEGTDYTVAWANNVKAGTATGTLTLKGNYTGAKALSFKIAPVPAAGVSVSGLAASYTFTGAAIRPALKVTAGTAALAAGTDYTVAYKNNVKVGTATGTLTLKGNYAGTKALSFKIAKPAVGATKVASLKAAKKAFTVTWKKVAKSKAGGYQVRYSTVKSMKGAKSKRVAGASKSSLAVKKLKAKKAYYVQVRTYKKVGGTTFYAKWSAAKKVTTKGN